MAIQFIINETIDEALFYWKKEHPTKQPEGIVINYHDFIDFEQYRRNLMSIENGNSFALNPNYRGLKFYRTEDIERNTIKIL